MEINRSRMPVVSYLLQHSLRSICTDSPLWAYAVFWRILPRNFPPPKWETEGGILEKSKANKRNWILVWEDGYCDFASQWEDGAGMQADLFFKMSHEVYNYGEGLIGKVAADTGHKWVYRDPSESDNCLLSQTPWHNTIDSLPRTWEAQFKSGIQTIALVAVGEGLLQLGSTSKVAEDMNVVVGLQKRFHYLQMIPGFLLPHPSSSSTFPLPSSLPKHLLDHQQQQQQQQWNNNMLGNDSQQATYARLNNNNDDDYLGIIEKAGAVLEKRLSWNGAFNAEPIPHFYNPHQQLPFNPTTPPPNASWPSNAYLNNTNGFTTSSNPLLSTNQLAPSNSIPINIPNIANSSYNPLISCLKSEDSEPNQQINRVGRGVLMRSMSAPAKAHLPLPSSLLMHPKEHHYINNLNNLNNLSNMNANLNNMNNMMMGDGNNNNMGEASSMGSSASADTATEEQSKPVVKLGDPRVPVDSEILLRSCATAGRHASHVVDAFSNLSNLSTVQEAGNDYQSYLDMMHE